MEVTQSINSHESNPIHLNQSNNQQITSNQHHQNNLNSYSFPPSRAYSESILERNRDNSSPEVTRSESVGPTKAINNDQFDAQAPNNLNYHHHRNFSSSRSSNNGFGVELEPAPTEYSSLGKQIYSGRQNFSFSEYISDLTEDNNGGTSSVRMTLENHATMPYTPHPSLQPFPTRLHAPGLLLRRPDYSSPFPPSNFAVPLSAPQVHSYQWNTSSPCCNNPEPHSHSHFAPPPPPQHYSDHSRLHYPQNDQRLLTTQFPYPGSYYGNSPGLMRSTSNQSNISNQSNVSSHGHYQSVGERGNFSDSDLRQHSESPFQGSDNDQKPQYSGSGPDRNAFASSSSTPQHQHQHHNSLTSTQGTPSPAFYNNNISAGAGHYVYGNKPITTPSNNMMKSLDLNPPEPGKTPTGRIKKVGVVPGSGKNIFHPTPASMLAPNATLPRSINTKTGRSVPAPFPGTNSPGIPSNADFAKMPTKRSRGRRPPCSPELGAIKAEDITTISKEEQIKFSGTTKTGKPKKIFFCGVPGCGKCFKRSEHLKRHVRSIHTNEKPFQCRWPNCGKLFSRHDNLSQHALRIHRKPNQSDESFSAQLEACFKKPTLQEQQYNSNSSNHIYSNSNDQFDVSTSYASTSNERGSYQPQNQYQSRSTSNVQTRNSSTRILRGSLRGTSKVDYVSEDEEEEDGEDFDERDGEEDYEDGEE